MDAATNEQFRALLKGMAALQEAHAWAAIRWIRHFLGASI